MLVGRTAELAEVDQLFEHADTGLAATLLVVGEPGIGKTALLAAAAARAARRRVRVVRVRAPDGEQEIPFALLDDLARAAALPRVPAGLGAAGRSSALLEQLVSLSSEAPLLLVVDDAQNADSGSLSALAVAVARAEGRRLVAVVATRPEPCVEQRFASWRRLALAPLDVEPSIAVLRSVLGSDPDVHVLALLADAFGGHPLALTEAPRLLSAEQIEGRAPLPDPMPVAPVLVAAWGRVLDRLPPPSADALLDLAVAGARPDLLAALAAARHAHADDLDPAVEAHLVAVGVDGPRFAHPLVRDVVLERTPPSVLRERHRTAATASRVLQRSPALVVGHLVRSSLLGDAGLADEIAAEAERAERLGALDAACRAWEAAARLSTDPGVRVERALRGVHVLVAYGLGSSAIGDLLDLLGGAPLDTESAGWVGWLRTTQRAGDDPAGTLASQWASIEAARRSSPGLLPVLLWEAAATAWTVGDTGEGLRAARAFAALDVDAPAGPVLPPWTGTALLAAAHLEAGDVVEAMRLRARAIAAADRCEPEALDRGTLLNVVLLDDLLVDAGPGAGHRLAVAEARLADAAEPLACVLGIQAWRARGRGDWDAARRLLARGRQLADSVGATGAQRGMAALAVELSGAGDEEAVFHREADRLRAVAARWNDRRRLATLDRALGLRALADGRPEAALADLVRAADQAFLGRGLRDGVLTARVDVIEALVHLGDEAAARRRVDEVAPLLEALGQPLALALRWRAEALVAPEDEVDAAFARSVAYHRDGADPFEEARTMLLRGERRRRARDRRGARANLEAAARLFADLSATVWLDRAHRELRACGGGAAAPAAPTDGALDLLTAREDAVVRSVARGCTTREAADELYLSPRTVEYHLGNAYRKLGVRGRGALASLVASSSVSDGETSRTDRVT